ncbi:hypothetical protein DSO57_1030778 [Entomophthora muscae]|uniref:Uncharacterized protein n=1 Tax=Entomophthora muscae TaxID=34485 RepID=A0ACC2ULM2_9FUNG|nr:hypothetical protein DSO57_1030778 [Entomophthora muscae]
MSIQALKFSIYTEPTRPAPQSIADIPHMSANKSKLSSFNPSPNPVTFLKPGILFTRPRLIGVSIGKGAGTESRI